MEGPFHYLNDKFIPGVPPDAIRFLEQLLSQIKQLGARWRKWSRYNYGWLTNDKVLLKIKIGDFHHSHPQQYLTSEDYEPYNGDIHPESNYREPLTI